MEQLLQTQTIDRRKASFKKSFQTEYPILILRDKTFKSQPYYDTVYFKGTHNDTFEFSNHNRRIVLDLYKSKNKSYSILKNLKLGQSVYLKSTGLPIEGYTKFSPSKDLFLDFYFV